MNLSRPERESAKKIAQRAIDAQAAYEIASKAAKDAREKLDAASREYSEAKKAFREWAANCSYLPIVDGAVVLVAEEQVICRPIQSVDEVAPAAIVTAPAVTEPQPSKPVRRAK